jgi:hypothetical protein
MSARVVCRIGSLVLIAVLMAAVHGAVLKSTMESVEAGQVLPLVGADFHEGMTVSLALVGVFDEHSVGEATADEEGGFTKDLVIPGKARPGDYQVVAYEPSGDRAAALDLTVLAASGSASAEAADRRDGAPAEHDEAEMTVATAEEMVIARSMTGAGLGVVGLVIGLAGGLGIALLRGAPTTEV